MRPLLPIALLAVAFAACGEQDGSAAVRPTLLRVTADPDGRGPETPRSIRVRCNADAQTRGCRVLRRLPRGALAQPDPGAVCTQVYGGPQTARVHGRLRGRRVDVRFDRTDGCGIDRWDRAAPLLELTGVTAAPAATAP